MALTCSLGSTGAEEKKKEKRYKGQGAFYTLFLKLASNQETCELLLTSFM